MYGLLIVSHGAFGESLIHSASHVLGRRPLYLRQLGVTVHDDPEALIPVAEDLIRYLDQGAGVLVLTDIYGAREQPIEGVTGKMLADLAIRYGHRDVHYVADKTQVPTYLPQIAAVGDLVITMGAGDIWRQGETFLAYLQKAMEDPINA